MKQFFIRAIAIIFAGLITLPMYAVAAGSATKTATININLTSACVLSSIPAVTVNYTAGQATAATGTSAFTVTCTQNLPYYLSIGTVTANQNTGSVSGTDTTTSLNYSAAIQSSGTTLANTPGQTGTGSAQSYTVLATVAANQFGKCAIASCAGSATQTITVSY